MNYKTTLMHVFRILKNKISISMVVLLSLLSLLTTNLHAQTLKTDSDVPLLDACADFQQFTVRIAKGGMVCTKGKLQIEIPTGFELKTGSAKVNGATATVTGESGQGVTITLPTIPAGPSSEEMVITYYVKALCTAIGSALPAAEQVVNYTFSGCGNTPQMGKSEIINIEYAVLRVSINPPTSSGKIGDEIVRTVTIRNQGNGEIPSLVLEKILGNGLGHVSYDFSSALGWTVDATNLNKLIFSGASLDTGGSITFKEKVRITGCDLSPSIFEAYYGCTTKCTNSNVNGIAQHTVNIDSQFQPKLEITAAPLTITCLNQKYTNTWNVKNTGNAEASSIGFEIGTNDAAGYIDLNSVKIGGVTVNPADITIIEGTAGAPKKIKVKLTADNTLDPNQVIEVKFDQFYGAPTAPTCDTAPTTFTTNNNYYNLSYDFDGGCGGPYSDTKTISPAVTYAYEGLNIGEIDVVTGQPYKADYLFTNFKVPFANLNVGDKFDVTIELSPMLSIANINDIKIITGATEVNFVASPDGANKYRLTFTYGTAPWNIEQDLDLSNSRLEFPMDFVCDVGADPSVVQDIWYKVGGELIKNPGCTPVSFKCNTVSLMGYCDAGPCPNGLHNRSADLERVTLGFGVDAFGKPTLTRVDKTNANIRTFITGDVLEISQKSDVVITSVASWTKVKFQVEKDVDTQVNLITNSGKLIVSRLGADTEFSGLTVTENATNYILEFDLTTQPNALVAFAQGDKVNFSMQFKALDSQLGLKKFPARSYLMDSAGNEFICGRSYTATGFYVNKSVDFKGAKTSFSTCENSDNKAVITSSILGYAVQDGVFTKEFRSLFEPTKATLTIPEHLTLKGLKVEIKNQPWLGINNIATITGLIVNNGNYVLDLTTIFNGLTGGRYLDEGFVLEITPTVALFECEPTATEKTQNITVVLDGSVVDGAGDKTTYTATQQLEYRTGYGSLTMELSNNNLNGEMSADGREVTWVVKVENTSNSRTFANVWLGKKTGNLVLKSVQKVDNYDGNNPLVGINPNGDVYELGDFAALSKSYYLVTADLINCNVESLTIPVGYSCTGYPDDVNSGVCVINDKVLTYSALKNNLQTTIAFQSNANTQHGFCDVLSYTVQIHNGGDSEVSKIVVKVPLGDAPGLKYNGAFKYSTPFMGAITPAVVFANGNPASAVIIGTDLVITLDNSIVLNTLERVQVKIDFKIESCDFRSGQRIAFEPTAENVCGSPIPQGSITNASGNRIIVAGGSTAFPEMVLDKNEIVLDPVLTVGGNLRAVYNFAATNSGNFGNKDAITTDYRVAFKFPKDWVMVGSPIDYLQPVGSATFEGIDPDRGYVYKITKNILVRTQVKLVNVPLKYVGTDTTTLTCEHNFGKIEVSIYQNIAVPTCVNPNLNCPNGIDQVLLEDQIPMVLPIDGMLMIVPQEQTREICNPLVGGGKPTLEDIMFDNGYFLSWYENELDANAEVSELPSSTPLIDGRTYYVVNRFIAGGLCRSNIAAIKVVLKANNLATANVEFVCSTDQKSYVIYATLNGTAPYTATGTGAPGTFNGNQWTSASIPIGTPYNVTFESKEACTPLVFSGIPPICCTLQIKCPNAVTVSCEQGYGPEITGIPTIITSCGNTSYTYSDGPIQDCLNGVRSFTRTFTVTDASGNVEDCNQIITIEDKVAPILNKEAQSITVSCGINTEEALSNWLKNHGGAQATDACGEVTWSNNYKEANFVDSCVGTKGSVKVTFTATDACGNKVSTTAIFTIEDKTPPTITKVAEGLTLECKSANYQQLLDAWLGSNGGATATDGCSNDVDLEWDHDFTVVTQGSCPGTGSALVTFTVTDPCGNKATTVATFTVVDTTAPTFTKKPKSVIVECDGKGNLVQFNEWLADHGGAEAADSCGTVTWSTTHIEDTNTICGITGTVIVDFIVTDACGNMAFEQVTFAIKDTKAPIIEKPASHLEIECGVHVEDELNAWLSNFGGAVATDNCGEVTWTHNYAGKLTVCGAPIEVTFTATDACNNKSVTMATVKVVDTIVPTITKEAQDLTVECNSNTELAFTNWLKNHGGAEAIDSCSIVTWTNDSETVDFISTCGKAGSYTVTFTATDACSRKIATTATFTVVDTETPKFVGVLPVTKMTVSCDVVPATPILVATDNCGEAVISFTEKRVGGLCANSYDLVRVWTATDSCGNATSFTQTITVEDKVAPKFDQTDLPANITVSCLNDVPVAAVLTATDNCGTADVVMTESQIDGICVNSFVLTRTWIATDLCGNSISHKQVITVEDKVAPTFVESLPKNITVSCLADIPTADVLTAIDNCGAADVVMTETKVAGTCVNSFVLTRIWTATDECGNTISHTQIVTVEDKIAPKFVEVLPSNITVSCLNDVPVAADLTATDNCGTADVVMTESQINGMCVNSFVLTRTWTATDECGNSISHTQIVTVEDKIAPTFVGTLPINITVSCLGDVPTAEVLRAEDNCGTADVEFKETKVDGTCANNFVVKRTWTATDLCGNITSHTQIIIVADKIAPIFDVVPQDVTVECDGTGNKADFQNWLTNFGNAVAKDNCSADDKLVWNTEIVNRSVLCGKTGNTVVKFTVTDECGNASSKQATFTIKDEMAPSIEKPADNLVIECGTNVDAQITTWLNNRGGAIASDLCGSVTWTNNYTGLTAACGNTGNATVVFTATDSCGNTEVTSATIRVVDTLKPTLVKEAQGLTVQCGTTTQQALDNWLANHAGAEATDSCSTVKWTNDYVPANFEATCGNAGSVKVIFTATDACNNVITTTATFTVVDTEAPKFVGTLPVAKMTVSCDVVPATPILVATDNCSEAVISFTEKKVGGLCANSYDLVRVWTATDSCGNATSFTQTITVEDKTAPEFTTSPDDVIVECDGAGNIAAYKDWLATFGNAVASDNCSAADKLVWTTEVVNTSVLCGKTGNTVVKFTVTDECGNTSSKQATFTIVDTIGPDFIVEAIDTTVACDGNGNANDLAAWLANHGGAKAIDACSNAVTWTNNFTGLVKACGSTGTATVIFTATDSCGNESETTAIFTIVDDVAPVFTTNLPKDLTLECTAGIPEAAVMNAVDACSTAKIEFTELRENGDCLGSYQLVRTWTATDSCGNTVSHVQKITIEDTTAPVFVDPLPAKELFLSCEDVKEREQLKAIDSCGTVNVTFTEETIAGDCPNRYDLLRTWTATDSCGNETEFEQTIHVACKIEFTNAISANGDGVNDEFQLKGIECYPGNTVEIFNRWGKLVYTTTNYNSNGNVFKGYANTKHVVSGGEKLPTGTYFYIVKYDFSLGNGTTQTMDQSGYIHLESN